MKKNFVIGCLLFMLTFLSCDKERPVITYLRVQNIDETYSFDELTMENAEQVYTINDLGPGETSAYIYIEKAVNNSRFTVRVDSIVIEKSHYYIDPSIEALLASGHYTYKVDIIDLENKEVRIELFKN